MFVDECPHVPDADELWQESWALFAWDPASGVFVFLRLGQEPNRGPGHTSAWINVWTPEGLFKQTYDSLPFRPSLRTATALTAGDGSCRYEYDGEHHWRVSTDDVQLRLRMADRRPTFGDWNEGMRGAAKEHVEAIGRAAGSVTVNGTPYEFGGTAWRDHSWGRRDWRAFRAHRYYAAIFGDELAFFGVTMVTPHGLIRIGTVLRGDETESTERFDIVVHLGEDGVSNCGGRVDLQLDGETRTLDFEPFGQSVVSVHQDCVISDALCRVTMGEEVGVGIAECSNNAQAGVGAPAVFPRSKGVMDNKLHRRKHVHRRKVIQWGTGWVGMAALRYVMANPQTELVGLRCHTEGKDGRDAGELAGGSANGVAATRNLDDLLALDADCVLFMPRDVMTDPTIAGSPSSAWVPDLLALLESGKNVIAPFCQMQHYRHLANGEAFRDQLDAACARGGGVTVHFTGIDPGFTTDALAFTLSSLCGEVEQLRTFEMLDYSSFPVHEMLTGMGFGVDPRNMPADGLKTVELSWGGSLHLLADAYGVELERIDIRPDFKLAPRGFVTAGGFEVAEGTIAALRFALEGIVDGAPRFSINHLNVLGADMAPDWPTVGHHGGYRVEIDGHPSLVSDLPLGQPGGTGSAFDDAMTMTAARCVNSIERIVQADAGYRTFLELPPIGASRLAA